MARDPSITFDQVAALAEQIHVAGGRPTVRAIRFELGTGSNATILRHLQAWQTNLAKAPADDTIDPSVVRAINLMMASRIEAAVAERDQAQADLQSNTDQVLTEAERLAEEQEARATELAAAREAIRDQISQIERLKEDMQRLQTDAEVQTQRATKAEQDLANTSTLLAQANARISVLEPVEQQLAAERATRNDLERQVGVLQGQIKVLGR